MTVLRPPVTVRPEHLFHGRLNNDDLLPLLSDIAGRLMEGAGPRPVDAVSHGDARPRIAVIANPRSRRGIHARNGAVANRHVLYARPDTREQMVSALESFVRAEIDLLVIDGGDGTVRDVMSAARPLFGDRLPPLGLIPSGKTNALANDLGIPRRFDLSAIRDAFARGSLVERKPVEITYDGTDVPLMGFIMGTGAFVRATMLAQHTHRIGAFNGTAVALSVAGGVWQTMTGAAGNPWRTGETMTFRHHPTQTTRERAFYLVLFSTLRRFPMGIRPLGRKHDGLNALAIDAPPRLIPLAAPGVLSGRTSDWLSRHGYHLVKTLPPSQITLTSPFILDGELFPGGSMSVRAGTALRFVVP